MSFNSNGNEPFGSYYEEQYAPQNSSKRPRAPYEFLILGLLALLSLLIYRFFFPATFALNPYVGAALWLMSLLAFILPFAVFSEINLGRQLNPDYRSNKQTARTAVFIFVLFGFATSLVHMLSLSSLLARILNVN